MHFPLIILAAGDGVSATQAAPASLWLVILIAAFALLFDFLNGFHDAANSIATIVSTRVLSPAQAVVWAAFFNFVAAFLFGTGVAATIGKGLIDVKVVDIHVVFGGLVGAIIWNIITWLLGLPTSSSHALVAGVAGSAIAKNGFGVLIWSGWFHGWGVLLLFIVLSPAIGFLLGTINMVVVGWIFRFSTPSRVDHLFRRLQLVSAGVYSLGHGGNDAQKTMGILVMLFTAAGPETAKWALPDPHHWFNAFNIFGLQHNIAWWIILSCQAAIALGTMFGGWRIVKTMGSSITRLQPVGGFCAEAAAATTIILATVATIPVSTTHAITGSILGVGSAKSIRSVRWIWGQRIAMAWILTIPCSAFIGAVSYLLIYIIFQR